MMEKWSAVNNFEGFYEISSDGLVKSLSRLVQGRIKGVYRRHKERLLRPSLDGYGYPFVILHADGYKKTKKVHQLVSEAFIGKCPQGFQVNHKNGDKSDNRIENLEYVTPRENTLHAINILGKVRAKETHWKHKVTIEEVEEMRKLYKAGGYTQWDLADKYGIHRGQVSKICNNKSWTA